MSAAFHEASLAGDRARMEELLGARVPADWPEERFARLWLGRLRERPELERWLSPPFVRGDRYGTRCSSVVLVDDGAIVFAERRYGPNGVVEGESFAHLPLQR